MYQNNGDSGYQDYLSRLKGSIPDFYKGFRCKIDQEKLSALLDIYVKTVDPDFVPDFYKEKNLGMASDEPYDEMVKISILAVVFLMRMLQ